MNNKQNLHTTDSEFWQDTYLEDLEAVLTYAELIVYFLGSSRRVGCLGCVHSSG